MNVFIFNKNWTFDTAAICHQCDFTLILITATKPTIGFQIFVMSHPPNTASESAFAEHYGELVRQSVAKLSLLKAFVLSHVCDF